MVERISKIRISYGEKQQDPRRVLSMRGFVSLPTSPETADATITSLTGLETSKMSVAGGEVAYGGSVFTGVYHNDREITITLRPRELTHNEIKLKLNSLMSMSMQEPLYFEVETITEKGVVSSVSTQGYITDVSASIFSKDPNLVVTFRSPKPWLQRPRKTVTSNHELYWEPLNSEANYFHGRRGEIRVVGESDDSAISAPSPVDVMFEASNNLWTYIKYITLTDNLGHGFTVQCNDYFKNNPPVENAIYGLDTYARRATAGDTDNEIMFADSTDIRFYVGKGWVSVYPTFTNLKVEVGYTSKTSRPDPEINNLTLRRYDVYPRVYGI